MNLYSPKVAIEIEKLFNKKYTLSAFSHELPNPSLLFSEVRWEVKTLQGAKVKLNDVKSKISHFYLEKWHKHTSFCNPAAFISRYLQEDVKPELLSRAWIKFYDILSTYSLIPYKAVETREFSSLHLCEAPGAFISALNHFIQCNHDIKWTWLANSLNPYYEGNCISSMIPDDRLMQHTFDNWCFGVDFSGDILNQKNASSIINQIIRKSSSSILMVTGDGGIDCQDNPSEQEVLTSALVYSEAVIAFHTLAPGGNLVLKMFTFFECESICLLYLLHCSFSSVQIFKPVASKSGNSEVYVICCEYKGSSELEPWLPKLLSNFDFNKKNVAIFPFSAIPESFLNDLINCAFFFTNTQIEVLEENVSRFTSKMKVKDLDLLKELKNAVATEYICRCGLESIIEPLISVSDDLKVCTQSNFRREENCTSQEWKMGFGNSKSFNEKSLKLFLKQCPLVTPKVLILQVKPILKEDLIMTNGLPIQNVRSSKFCSAKFFQHWLRFYDSLKPLSTPEIRLNYFSTFVSDIGKTKVYDIIESNSLETDHSIKKQVTIYIIKILSALKSGECLLLIGYDLWTQYNVGLLYLLCILFSKVQILPPDTDSTAIYFEDFQPSSEVLEYLLNIPIDSIDGIMSLLKLSYILERIFFKNIVSCNDTYLFLRLKRFCENHIF